jgi:uncharacterized protein (TIGR01777 family)
LKVLVTGASGLIGSALVARLEARGDEVVRLTRSQPKGPRTYRWSPDDSELDARAVDGVHAAVHLAGETVVGRWTQAKKRRILESRARGTTLVSAALAGSDPAPAALLCASGIGYYGDRGDTPLTEQSAPGASFLAEVARQWEAATAPARDAGIRVVNLRFGIVQSPHGGALATLLPIFRLGLGGRVGNGRQYVSWVAIDDVVGAIEHALATDSIAGPINVVAPAPVTNAEYARTLARLLHRPALMPAPAFAVRAVLGEFAQELLGGQRVLPARLAASGYEFRYPELELALRHLLRRA